MVPIDDVERGADIATTEGRIPDEPQVEDLANLSVLPLGGAKGYGLNYAAMGGNAFNSAICFTVSPVLSRM